MNFLKQIFKKKNLYYIVFKDKYGSLKHTFIKGFTEIDAENRFYAKYPYTIVKKITKY